MKINNHPPSYIFETSCYTNLHGLTYATCFSDVTDSDVMLLSITATPIIHISFHMDIVHFTCSIKKHLVTSKPILIGDEDV